MWSSWLNESALPALEQSAAFAQKRHNVLAGNIANLDVPGYQTRDLSVDDFHEALQDMLTANSSGPTSPHETPVSSQEALEQVRDVSQQVLYHDGSDVSLEGQVAQISKNAAMHDMALALMRSQFRTIEAAIRESVSV